MRLSLNRTRFAELSTKFFVSLLAIIGVIQGLAVGFRWLWLILAVVLGGLLSIAGRWPRSPLRKLIDLLFVVLAAIVVGVFMLYLWNPSIMILGDRGNAAVSFGLGVAWLAMNFIDLVLSLIRRAGKYR